MSQNPIQPLRKMKKTRKRHRCLSETTGGTIPGSWISHLPTDDLKMAPEWHLRPHNASETRAEAFHGHV